MICKLLVVSSLLSLSLGVHAELRELADQELSQQSGQGGVYLSGDFSINKDGGPLWSTPASLNQSSWTKNERSCAPSGATQTQSCGMRVAIRAAQNGGWYVLDNLKGTLGFEGLTLRSRHVDSGFNGDGAAFNQDVLEVGLPGEVRFNNASFVFATASHGGWQNNQLQASQGGNPAFQQTNIFSAQMDGTMKMQGNVLVFPTN